jgi:hypothetical protein
MRSHIAVLGDLGSLGRDGWNLAGIRGGRRNDNAYDAGAISIMGLALAVSDGSVCRFHWLSGSAWDSCSRNKSYQ